MQWLKANWLKFLPLITLLGGVIGSAIGVKFSIDRANVSEPEIHILIPQADGSVLKVPAKVVKGKVS